MIDFHSHIIPKIDDGSKSMEETITMIEEAKMAGFTHVIATSHYIEDYYEANEEEREEYIKQIQEKIDGIDIIKGNEIYISQNIVNLIKNKKASTINQSRYVLFELPMNSNVLYLKDVIYEMQQNKLVPVLAHPERYSYIQKNPEWLIEYINMGVLFQANFGSVIGKYGKEAKRTVEILLRNNMIHFLGSDSHRRNSIYLEMPKIIKKLNKIISKEKIYELTTTNQKLVLKNKKIEVDEVKKIKLNFFEKINKI